MRLEELAQALYAAAPGDFVAMRDRFVREARQAGDRELAAALRGLRRPTQGAWLVNLLVRERPELVAELLEIGGLFRGGELTRQRMVELSTARRELLHRVVTEAAALGEAAGVRFSDDKAREIESTFGAAMADEDAAAQLRTGRLATTLSYSGFGPQLQLVPSLPQDANDAGGSGARGAGGRAVAGPGGGPVDGPVDGAPPAGPGLREQRERRAEARAAVRSAERALLDRGRARDRAVTRLDRLTQRRDDLRTELELVQSRLAVVEGELDAAEQSVREHTDAVETTQRELDAARDLLDDLS